MAESKQLTIFDEIEDQRDAERNADYKFEYTGDAFVDTGGVVLEYFFEKYENLSREAIFNLVLDVYINNWDGKLYSFFLNHPITQASYKTPQIKKDKAIDLYFNKFKTSRYKGFCRICSKEAVLCPSGRESNFVCGSSAFVNFHHNMEEGLMLCQECLIKLFFVPLAVFQAKNIILVQPNSDNIKEFIKQKVISANIDNFIGKKLKGGVFKFYEGKPENGLFLLANELIEMYVSDSSVEEQINLWEFTNFAQSPLLNIISLPSNVYTFLAKMRKKNLKTNWDRFIFRHFSVSKYKWDPIKSEYVDNKGISCENTNSYYNKIINKLLDEKSIIPEIREFNRKNMNIAGNVLIWQIIDIYLKEVLLMQKETIEVIKKVGDKIFEFMAENASETKILTKLEGAKSGHELRMELLRLVKQNYILKAELPLVSFDEYVLYLFPDGQYWQEVRDLLLIYLYEKLHANKDKVKIELKESIEEPVTDY